MAEPILQKLIENYATTDESVSPDVITQLEKMKGEIKFRAKQLVEDNMNLPLTSDYLLVESAMLIGATVAIANGLVE